MTYVHNLSLAVELALESAVPSGVFNIADGVDPSTDDMLRTMLHRCGVSDRILHVPYWAARMLAAANESVWRLAGFSSEPSITRYAVAHLAESFTLDLTRARAELGYAPRWSFRDAPLDSV